MINIIIVLITDHAGESKTKIPNKKNSKTIGYSKIATRPNPLRISSFYPSYCFLEHHTHRLKIKLIVAYSVSCTFYYMFIIWSETCSAYIVVSWLATGMKLDY